MYVLCDVQADGCIRLKDGWHKIVHRESLGVHTWSGVTCYSTLDAAKNALQDGDENIILGLDKEGAGDSVWMFPAQKPVVQPRLNRWRGCYGTWKVLFLNART